MGDDKTFEKTIYIRKVLGGGGKGGEGGYCKGVHWCFIAKQNEESMI